MKTKILSLLYIWSLVLSLFIPVNAQQKQEAAGVVDLRELIRKLESVNNDLATPPELREINSKILRERQGQLVKQLESRASALRTYLVNIGPSLSKNERQVVKSSLVSLEGEIARVETALRTTDTRLNNDNLLAAINVPAGLRLAPREESQPLLTLEPELSRRTGTNPDVMPALQDDGGETQKGNISVSNDFKDTNSAINPDGTLIKDRITRLFNETFGQGQITADDPCIIHIVVWKQKDNKYEAESETWYLYRDGELLLDEDASTRIFGKKNVAVLLIHINATAQWNISYKMKATKKLPANLADVKRLAELVLRAEAGETLTGRWGGKIARVPTPSDIQLTGKVEIKDAQGAKAQDAVSYTSPVFDNEGRYYWDVSVGLPVQGVKEIQFKADDGVVRPREVKRQNAYGFLNLFPFPVDVKGDDSLRKPHLVLGVPISGKPLDRPIVALGMGMTKKNFFAFDIFAGAVFNRIREPRTLVPGDTATENELESDLQSRRVTKFIFGVNLPVSTFTNLLDPKK